MESVQSSQGMQYDIGAKSANWLRLFVSEFLTSFYVCLVMVLVSILEQPVGALFGVFFKL